MKEITHEEVKEFIKWSDLSMQDKWKLNNYVEQQQAEEERAKKEHELLELQKEFTKCSVKRVKYYQLKQCYGSNQYLYKYNYKSKWQFYVKKVINLKLISMH